MLRHLGCHVRQFNDRLGDSALQPRRQDEGDDQAHENDGRRERSVLLHTGVDLSLISRDVESANPFAIQSDGTKQLHSAVPANDPVKGARTPRQRSRLTLEVRRERHIAACIEASGNDGRLRPKNGQHFVRRFAIAEGQRRGTIGTDHLTNSNEILIHVVTFIDDVIHDRSKARQEHGRHARQHDD